MAATDRIGIVTPVIINPIVETITFLPASCPKWIGKIKLPAPKNKPNKVMPMINLSLLVNFVFIIKSLHILK